MTDILHMGTQETVTYRYEQHSHPYWEITYYLEGSGTNMTAGKAYPFSAGTIICQPPGQLHEDISPAGYKNIFFLVRRFDIPSVVPVLAQDSPSGDFLIILKQLYKEYFSGKDGDIQRALLDVLFAYLIRRFRAGSENPWVEQLKQEILFAYSTPGFQLGERTRSFPLSETAFRALFLKETGMTPQQFLLSVRIGHAKRLLQDSTLSVGNIASLCGYADPYYFSRLFRKYCGSSPEKWRKNQP